MLSTMTTAEKSMDVINQVAVTVPPNSEKIIIVRTEVDTRGNQCSIFEPQVVSTPGILISRSLVKPDETVNVPIRVANILDQAVNLQSNKMCIRDSGYTCSTDGTSFLLIAGRVFTSGAKKPRNATVFRNVSTGVKLTLEIIRRKKQSNV